MNGKREGVEWDRRDLTKGTAWQYNRPGET